MYETMPILYGACKEMVASEVFGGAAAGFILGALITGLLICAAWEAKRERQRREEQQKKIEELTQRVGQSTKTRGK